MWKRRIARKALRYFGLIGGMAAFLIGVIGCVWEESTWKFLFLAVFIAGGVVLFVYAGEWALSVFLHSGRDEVLRADIREHTKRRLLTAAESFEALSCMFDGTNKEEERSFQRFAVTLPELCCQGCEGQTVCFGERLRETYLLMHEMYQEAMQGNVPGYAETERRFAGCRRIDRLVEEFSELPFRERSQQFIQTRLAEGRDAVKNQLGAVSSLLREYSEELYESTVGDGQLEEIIADELYALHILAEQIVVMKRRGRGIRVCMRARTRSRRSVPARRIAGKLTALFHCRISLHRESNRYLSEQSAEYVFEEEPGYLVLTGIARAAKYPEVLSGDSFSFLYPDTGETVLLLSDGCGSGKPANEESGAIIGFLEQLLSAGFDEKIAVRLINSILLLRSEGRSCSSVDISVLNPYTGTCEFIKLGAAGTFLKREDWVESILSESLPVGMLTEAEYEAKEKKLFDGDYVIMMSDGVAEALSDELANAVLSAGQEQNDRTPQRVASEILKAALVHSEYKPKDDMTVLCAKLVRRAVAIEE